VLTRPLQLALDGAEVYDFEGQDLDGRHQAFPLRVASAMSAS
jgi:hypothetical protein